MTSPSADAVTPGCRFCLGNALLIDEPLSANRSVYLLGSIDQDLPAAAMIVPFRHSETPFEMNAGEWADVGDMLREARDRLASYRPDGYSIGWNVGAAAGQKVFHAHLHVIARFAGDPQDRRGLGRDLRQTRPHLAES